MGKKGKERKREKREQRLQEISHLRSIPYAPHERWWSKETTAVVTGANRGIGYEIAHQLAMHGLNVVLTSRDFNRAQEAAKTLQAEGLSAQPRQLDITDPCSVQSFACWIQLDHGGIDILVNNAGVNFNSGTDNSVEFAETVIKTNFYGTKRMIETMLPLMRRSPFGARIVNVSSRLGRANGGKNVVWLLLMHVIMRFYMHMPDMVAQVLEKSFAAVATKASDGTSTVRLKICDPVLRENLIKDETVSEQLLDEMLNKFLTQVNEGTWQTGGWPPMYTDYSLSKLAVTVYTRYVAKSLADRPDNHKVYINCFCPGYVKTQMTNWEGNTSAAVGADTGVWLALLSVENISNGKFYAERREIEF